MIVTDKLSVAVVLVADTVTVYVPLEGVPETEIKPVVIFTDKPTGKPVALKLPGLLVAAIW